MLKLKFPKEKPEIAQTLEDAKKLITGAPRDMQTLSKAYKMISDCAETGSPRANFLKACFLYSDEPNTGDYQDDILAALEIAEKGQYPLASGLKTDYLLTFNEPEALQRAIRKEKDSPQALYCMGGFLSGYCAAPEGVKQNPVKACEYFEKAAWLYLEYDNAVRQGCKELTDITVCFQTPYYFSLQAGFAFQMLMFVYSDLDVKANVQKYIAAYANAQKYGNASVRYKTAAVRATDCINNVMGMHSLKTVNAVLNTAKAAFAELDEAQQENSREGYDAMWEQYDEFYDYEMERLEALGNMEVTTSPDYAKQDSLLSDFVDAVQHWANTPTPKTKYTVTVDNKEYQLNDLGEMVDEYGQRNGLRVDTTSKRVYDSKNDAVGYFDSFGCFHKY